MAARRCASADAAHRDRSIEVERTLLPGRGQMAYQANCIVWEFLVQPLAGSAISTAEAYLAILRDRGVEYLFANAGTDFAPIVEGYAKASVSGTATPTPITATHENLAL